MDIVGLGHIEHCVFTAKGHVFRIERASWFWLTSPLKVYHVIECVSSGTSMEYLGIIIADDIDTARLQVYESITQVAQS